MYMCMCMYGERKERREPAGESQSHIDSDGVSESENKRQEKTLKVVCFIEAVKHGEDTLTNKVCRRAPRAAHERDQIANEIV